MSRVHAKARRASHAADMTSRLVALIRDTPPDQCPWCDGWYASNTAPLTHHPKCRVTTILAGMEKVGKGRARDI